MIQSLKPDSSVARSSRPIMMRSVAAAIIEKEHGQLLIARKKAGKRSYKFQSFCDYYCWFTFEYLFLK